MNLVLLGLLGFFLFYLALLSVFAATGALRANFESSRERIFAVVVPAHNEELVIERTLDSLFRMNYRREFFDVIVVADHCSDRTAEIARSLGAIVFERDNQPERGKGHALRWCFEKLLSPPSDYEAVVVVDADTVASRNFLSVLNFYLERGAEAVQAADVVEPTPGLWSPEVTRVGLTLNNYARPLGRRFFGFSSGLRGNGMCFSAALLRDFPWNAFSLTEDLEYGLNLLLNGHTVIFAPEAAVYAKMPTEARNAETQRARWEGGRVPVIRKYSKLLLAAAIKRKPLLYLDALIDLITPAFTNMVVVVLGMLCLNLLGVWTGVVHDDRLALCWCVLVLLGGVHVLVGLAAAHADSGQYRALLYFPRYAAWKLYLYLKLLTGGGPRTWIRTDRERDHLRTASGKSSV